MAGLVGQTLGRYEIVALVGKGGMGEVFRATDRELGRDVAVKVLSAETARDKGRVERFKREARSVARLSHPNILDIHDFGTQDGVTYSVTELLEGSDLHERLAGHALPLSKVVKIGCAVAEGLAAAHGKGIVHRDIKPGNIFLTTDGQVKILDFGIARLRTDVTSSPVNTRTPTLTEAGQIVGTTAYMSPEQVAGRPADSRSDIFSLGCVLYEMLTGRRAFNGASANETMVAIVSEDPVPIAELRSDVPPALEMLVSRCLEKEPEERFESARDVAFSLQTMTDNRTASTRIWPLAWIRSSKSLRAGFVGAAVTLVALIGWKLVQTQLPTTPELPITRHLAVMDFTVVEGDEALREFADGLTETVSASLRLLEIQTNGAVWVVSRRDRDPGDPWTLEPVARQHGLTLGVKGHVGFLEGKVRVVLELWAPGDVRPLRTAIIEDQIDNVMTFQVAPLIELASMLEIELDQASMTTIDGASTTVVPALTSYLSGVGRLVRAENREDVIVARGHLEDAVARDPTFLPAKAALLRSCGVLLGLSDADDGADQCVRSVPPLESRPGAEISAAAAMVLRQMGDHEGAVRYMQRAVSLGRSDAELQLRLGRDQQDIGRFDEAESAFQRSISLRFDYWEGHFCLGYLDYVRGRYEGAANAWRTAALFAPERSILFSNLGAVVHYLGRPAEAAAYLERAIELSEQGSRIALTNLGTLYFESAQYAEAVATLQKALALKDTDYRIWGALGWSYSAGVDPARAIEPFERAVELAEIVLDETPDDPDLLAKLAGYHGMLGHRERASVLIERAVALDPQDPEVMAAIGETLEDLGDRDRALEWIERSLRQGGRRTQIESHPSLRNLVSDERYQELVDPQDSSLG